MDLKRSMVAAAVMGAAMLAGGCVSAPAEVRVQGAAESGQARACLALARKLWDRDVLESLRHFRRGAELRDGECARQYLAHAESPTVNLSQRVYARLFIEGLLRKGPILTTDGEDLRSELTSQLAIAWRTVEPRSPAQASQVQDAARDHDARRQEIQLYAGESADEMKRWLQVPLLGDGRATGDWTVFEANAWGGGSDRLLLGTNVLAFLVNAQGEPSFRGTHLWICNLGRNPVHVTSFSTGLGNRELLPGREELAPLLASEPGPVTGIPLSVRHRRLAR